MRWWVSCLVLACGAGCDARKGDVTATEAPTATASTPSSAAATTLAAAELCDLVMGAPRRALEARCGADEKRDPAYAYLVRLADERVQGCVAALKDDAGPGWAKLPADRARACADALSKRSWHDSLAPRSVAHEPACRDLVVGMQPADAPCHADAACGDGLFCAGAGDAAPGRCTTLGEPCEARRGEDRGFLARATCSGATRCNADSPPRRFPLGFDGHGAPTIAGDQAERAAALQAAADQGVVGLIAAGEPLYRGLDRVVRGLPPDDSDPHPPPRSDSARVWGEVIGVMPPHLGSGRPLPRSTPTKIRQGPITVKGRLAKEVIQRVERQHFGRLRHCYDAGLARNPRLEGRVDLQFTIGPSGEVSTVSRSGDLPDAVMAHCVADAVRRMRFPKPEGGVVVVSHALFFHPHHAAVPPPPPVRPPPPPVPPPPKPDVEASAPLPAPPARDTCLATAGCAHAGDCEPTESCFIGHCRPLGAAASPCIDTLDCEPGLYCKPTPEGQTCRPREPAGSPCTSSLACEGYCGRDNLCVDFCSTP